MSATADGLMVVERYEALKASRVLPAVDEISSETLKKLCDVLDDVCLELFERGGSTRGICLRCAGYYETECPLRAAQGDCALHPSHQTPVGDEESMV